MKQKHQRYHDLLTKAQETQAYIWNVERYDPNGGVRTLSIMCTKEEFDERAVSNGAPMKLFGADTWYMSKLVENFAKELKDAK